MGKRQIFSHFRVCPTWTIVSPYYLTGILALINSVFQECTLLWPLLHVHSRVIQKLKNTLSSTFKGKFRGKLGILWNYMYKYMQFLWKRSMVVNTFSKKKKKVILLHLLFFKSLERKINKLKNWYFFLALRLLGKNINCQLYLLLGNNSYYKNDFIIGEKHRN